MNTIVNFLMRAFGLGKAVDALDGESSKAYMGGVGQILTGAATLLGGLAGIAGQLVGAHGGAEYVALAKGLAHDPSAGLVLGGAALISKGWADIGQRHALAKAVNDAKATEVVPSDKK